MRYEQPGRKSRQSRRKLAAALAIAGFSAGAMAYNVPADPNTFLTFLEHYVPEDSVTAAAYYDAIDPGNRFLTAKAWARNAGFIADEANYVSTGDELNAGDDEARGNAYAFALYRNAADLGFIRRMFIRCVPADCATAVNPDVFTYVENYAYLEGTPDPFSDAKARRNRIATVAFNWTAAADGSNPDVKFGTIYAFLGQDDEREPGSVPFAPNLDGRGAKQNPGVCMSCHGGFPKALVNGVYPDNGRHDGFKYLPFDLENFQYSDTPGLTRADLEPAFRRFNTAVLRTHKAGKQVDDQGVLRQAAGRELIEGWYGGKGLPYPAFNPAFVPKGWREPASGGNAPAGSEHLYLTTIAPACRACHAQQEQAIDFATERGFRALKPAIKELVMKVECGTAPDATGVDNRSVMPLAKLTYERFWQSDAQVDALKQYLGIGPRFCNR